MAKKKRSGWDSRRRGNGPSFFSRFGFNAVLAHPGEDYCEIPNSWEAQL